MEFYEFEEQDPVYDNRKGEIDWYERYGNLIREVEKLSDFVEEMKEVSSNGIVVLISHKLQSIVGNEI